MKFLIRSAVVALILLALAAGLAFIFVDRLVRATVARGGSWATGVETTLAHADVGLVDGGLGLSGFRVANPEGFSAPAFLELSEARAAWRNETLWSDAIEIDEVAIDGVGLDLERAGGRTNYGVILANLERLSAKDGAKDEKSASTSKPARTLRIKKIVVTDVRASVHLTDLGAGPLTVRVPRVEIDDFTSSGSTSEIIGKIVAALVPAILNATIDAGGGALPKELAQDLGRELERWKSSFDAAKAGLKGAENALKGLEDLFKKPR